MRLASRAPLLLAVALVFAAPLMAPRSAPAQNAFKETDLVSDLSGRAARTDPNLVNPWGLAAGPNFIWVSNNATGTSTLYAPDGTPNGLVVRIPGGGNTGVVITSAQDSAFAIPQGDTTVRAVFIFVTENGTVAAWSNRLVPVSQAIQVASTPNAVYKGAALVGPRASPRLLAANFHAGRIDVFDSNFHPVTPPAGAFTDPNLPAGFAPFNVANILGQVFVAYAKQDAQGHDEVAGPGLGYIDVFDEEGHLVRRFASGGGLNAPWAIVQAPPGFGSFPGDLLVGNFGDGRINAFAYPGGGFRDSLRDSTGTAISIDGLWGMFAAPNRLGSPDSARVYFAAGLNDEAHGLFGFLSPGRPAVVGRACDNHAQSLAFWQRQCAAASASDGGGKGKGRGVGKGKGKGKGDGDNDGDDHGKGKGKGPKGGGGGDGEVSADSLNTLFACIGGASRTFGPGGCFTAGCDLLGRKTRSGSADGVAQLLLVLLLDRCSGLACDSSSIDCRDASVGTVGDVIGLLESGLCGTPSHSDLRRFANLATCASNGGDGDHDADDRGGHVSVAAPTPLTVTTIDSPIAHGGATRFALTTETPGMVRLRIVDATGRLVAEPLRNVFVVGSIQATWDGRDQRGVLVPPGNYFYRASSGAGEATGRIVVLR